MTPEQEQECREEAERLHLLPRDDQQAFIAMLRADGKNRKVPKADRDFAHERADALERFLKQRKRKSK